MKNLELRERIQQKSEMRKLITSAELRAKLKHISGLLFCLATDIGLQEDELSRLRERNKELEIELSAANADIKEFHKERARLNYRKQYRKRIAGQMLGQRSNL